MGVCGFGRHDNPRDDPRVGCFCGKYYPLEIIDREDKVRQQPRDKAKLFYDLQKNLTLTVKPQRNIVRISDTDSQNIPMLINLHTTDYTKEEMQNRSPIDLICIVDKSGSMEGQKMQLLKRALHNLLRLTKENDRICLIQFDSKAQQLTPLLRNTRQNGNQLRQAINSIKAEGDNNMNDALKIAFQVLKNRSTVNPIASIFILTDGVENSPYAHQEIKRSLQLSGLQDQNFAISCFGFGNDHDQQLLVNVARLKDGNFYYIETLERIDESFISALAGLMSIVGLNTTISVKNIAQQPFQNIKINHTFGDKWVTKHPNSKLNQTRPYYLISLNQLEAGKDKGFVSQIQIPSFNSRFMTNYNIVELIVLQVNVQVLDKSKSFVVNLNKKLNLTIINNKHPPVAIEDDGQVLQNYFRIKGSLAIEAAVNQANQRYYSNARQNIQNIIDQINKDRVVNKQKLRPLVEQLKKCQQSCQQNKYQDHGRKQMLQINHIVAQQQASPTFSTFNNQLQRQMISQTILMRGKY